MLPRVKQPAEVEEFVAYLKYPPAGQRGMAAGLGNTDFRGVNTVDYINFSNEEVLVIIQIETKEALSNLEALAGVAGVDVFFIGPDDLSIASGFAGQPNHPAMLEKRSQIIATAQRQQIIAGLPTSQAAAIPALVEQGIRLIAYASDVEFIYNGARQAVEALAGNQ
jgi:2-keto-3-deoxy-L-rhamnonate aldolase RhmA